MTCAAADRNDDVSAADNNDDDAITVSTKTDNDCNIKHNRSASEGGATASACRRTAERLADGGKIDHQDSASVDDEACASSMAVAVQMCPRVTWREGAVAWVDVLVTASSCRCAIALHALVT